MNSKLVWASLKSFLQSMFITVQTILNEQIMDQIERSGEDVKNDRVRTSREFLKELYSDCGDMR